MKFLNGKKDKDIFIMIKLIALIIIIISASGYSQQDIKKPERDNLSLNDTIRDNIERLNSFKLRFHTFRQKFFSDELNLNEPVLPYSTWMLKSGFSSSNIFAPLLQKGDMIRSYKMLYGVDEDFKYLQTILGMAQTATVGVLAYKHIKKYGFLSK